MRIKRKYPPKLSDRRPHSPAAIVRYFARSSGIFPLRFHRSILVHGETPAQFEAAESLLRSLKDDFPHFRLVLASKRLATLSWLRKRFVDDAVSPAPWDFWPAVKRVFSGVTPRIILLLDSGAGCDQKILKRAVAARIPLVVIDTDGRAGELSGPMLSALISGGQMHICVRDGRTAASLQAKGVPAKKITVTDDPDKGSPVFPGEENEKNPPESRSARENELRSERIYAAVKNRMPSVSYEPPVQQAWRIKTLRDRAGQSGLWKKAAPLLMKRRIDAWESLRLRLHDPQSILCLGNGPSSEDPRVRTVDHDCLIRINWRWKSRRILTRPDIVFVGDAATLHRVSSCVFGLWNISLEYGMLLRYFVTHGPRLMEYITLERLSPIIRDREWPARPTNGALMILTAAALEPKRMTISGMDLFRHPDGKYPGDPRSLNAYSSVHTRDVDLAIIRLALERYRGELVILSDSLREILEGRNVPKDKAVINAG